MKKTFFTFIILFSSVVFIQAQNTFPSTGAVGIGTTSPQADLDIDGGAIIIGGTQKHIIHTQNWVSNADALIFAHEIAGSWEWGRSLNFKTNGTLEKSVLSNDDKAFVVKNEVNWPSIETFRVMGDGKVFATEIEVLLASQFPDYVFKKDYNLMSLGELRNYIEQNNKLPNIPSAEEMNGSLQIGEMVRLQMEKIEELTLYVLELQKEIEVLKQSK